MAGMTEHQDVAAPMPSSEPADSARLLEAVLDSTPSAIAIYETDADAPWGSRLLRLSAAFTELTGYSSDELAGTGLGIMAGPETDSPTWQRLIDSVRHGKPDEGLVRLYGKDGQPFWDEIHLAPIQLASGPDVTGPEVTRSYWMARHCDVTEQRERAAARDQELAFLSLLGASAPYQSAVLAADGRILAVNDAWRTFWSARTGDSLPAEPGSNFLTVCEQQLVLPADQKQGSIDGFRRVTSGLRAVHCIDYEAVGFDAPRWFQLQCTGIDTAGLPGQESPAVRSATAVVTLADITARKLNEAELSRRALTDLLTGLLNRAGLVTRLASSSPPAQSSAVLIDLDAFKQVNDSYGHSLGDELLVTIAIRISQLVGDSGLTCRLSGDGFLVYLADRSPGDTEAFAATLLDAIAAPVPLRGGSLELTVTAAAGVAHSSTSRGIESLLRDADSAMYRAKELGRSRIEVYTPALNERSLHRLDLEMGLRRALADRDFVLYYQPIIDLRTGATLGQEALLRWQSPEGLRLPGVFLEVAESSGLIRPIGHWALREALRHAALWRQAGHDWVVHVNVAATQLLDDEIVHTLTAALAAHALPGSSVCLEVTETELLPTIDGASAVLERLHATGAGLALDDFGVGYFSLSHLIDLPVTMLKIDRSFVQGLDDRSHVAIVSALTTLSGKLDLEIVAEGLETAEQVAQVRALGCTIGQGYLFGRPVRDAVPGRLGFFR